MDPLDPMPEPPLAPDDFDCCGSGCGDTCVWSYYRAAQQEYAMNLAAWQARNKPKGAGQD